MLDLRASFFFLLASTALSGDIVNSLEGNSSTSYFTGVVKYCLNFSLELIIAYALEFTKFIKFGASTLTGVTIDCRSGILLSPCDDIGMILKLVV